MPLPAARTLRAARHLPAARQVAVRLAVRLYQAQDSYVTIPDNPLLDGTAALSLMCWCLCGRCGPLYGQQWPVIKQPVGGNPTGYGLSVSLRAPSHGGSGQVDFYTGNGGYVDMWTNAPAVLDGGWHHLAATWDGATKLLYVDGAQIGAQAFVGLSTNTGPLHIGDDPGWEGRSYNGAGVDGFVSDVLWWGGRALSAAEVASAYNGTPPGDYTSRWRLDAHRGATAVDSGLGGMPGTLTNGAAWSIPAPAR